MKEEKKNRDKAVALRYNREKDSAPKVVAKGEGYIAREIRKIADENGIPLREDDVLIELLSMIEIDREIPAELYGAVAEILSWIYRANESIKEEKD